jgi:hypothetical protein
MSHGIVTALLALGLLAASTGPVPDPCGPVTVGEVTAAVGAPASPGDAMRPGVDDETGARVTACVLEVDEMVVSIAVGEFDTPTPRRGR